ncbi:hypothetical protein EJ08DRAFT_675933 [Tothia fuscella]|uniref:Dihydrofolate reductase n=1 Tax=Tothia fuscella TaxID=1048955 RepID=A0A9P4U2Z0_9PEZI|nr:hypothetical protein EJ08DRAFT_675933 [Tothia fuscella]
MEASELNGDAMRKRIRSRVAALIKNYAELLDLAIPSENKGDNNDLATTSSKAYRMDMATQGMIRAAEDLLSLIHQMKEIWLFGKLDTTRSSEVQEQTEEDAKAIVALLRELKERGLPNEGAYTISTSTKTPTPSQPTIQITSPQATAATMPKSLPLTLIVAATPSLGIGANGALPWRIKSEIQYFARVTTRLPSSIPMTSNTQNAVIMGRKTWESIPKKFRPLKGRINVVLSSKSGEGDAGEGALWVRSLREGVEMLSNRQLQNVDGNEGKEGQEEEVKVARVFVIGGATVYKAALEMEETERVLLTKVQGDHWGCDTFFPVQLDGEEGGKARWKKNNHQELDKWVGEDVPAELVREGDVQFEYCMYEKADTVQAGNDNLCYGRDYLKDVTWSITRLKPVKIAENSTPRMINLKR